MTGLEVIHGKSRQIIRLEQGLTQEAFIEKIMENAGNCHCDHDHMFLVRIDDDNIYHERLTPDLVWGHGNCDDGIQQISIDYIQNLREGGFYDYILDALEENLGRYIAELDVYPDMNLDELRSCIFDNMIDVCKYYMRTCNECIDEYCKYLLL